MPGFRVASVIAVIAAVLFAAATSLLSYLAAVSAASPRCIGRELIEGYRSGTTDFLALPLLSVCAAAIAERTRRSPTIIDLIKSFHLIAFQIGSFAITYGTLLACSVLFGFAAFNAAMTRLSATRYEKISAYCHAELATTEDPLRTQRGPGLERLALNAAQSC